MLILIVAEGPDKGRIYEWSDDQTVVVGRESKEFRLSDGKASRQHARFKCEGGTWSVRDLASRHGTLVNGIRTQGKTPLRDGDRVKIGRTELVVARIPAEQAERAALLGDQPSRGEAWRAMPNRKWYLPRPTTAAAAIAAVFAIGASTWLYLNTTGAYHELSNTLIAKQDASTQAQLDAVVAQTQATEVQLAMADRTDQILSEVEALGAQSTPVLHEILASVQSQDGNNAMLSDIHQALAEMHNASMTTLDTILAGVESQSNQWQALAQVRDALGEQQAEAARLLPELQTVAATAQANEAALLSIQKQIEVAQSRPDLSAEVLDELEAVMAELKARPSLERVVTQVRTALASEQKQTNELLSRIEQGLAANPDTQALIAPLRDALAEQTEATEKMIAQAFLEQGHTSAQLLELKSLLEAQPAETATALRDVIDELDTSQQLQQVLAAIDSIQAGATDGGSLAMLRELSAKLEAAPSSQELADAVTRAVSEELNTTRPMLEKIAGSLDAAAQQSETGRELVEQLRLALLAQEAADTRLDQIYDMLASAEAGEDSEALRQVLREIRSKSIAGMDEMRSTIRREIQAGLTGQRLATARQSGPPPTVMPEPIAEPEPVAAPPVQTPSGTLAMAAEGPQAGVTVTEKRKDGLTDVEHAYRLAFKTGKPITLGGGAIDPKTGAVSKGRTIDPAAAKAAGITDWRDWYLMDDFAERMRLQQQAIEFHDEHRDRFNVLGIPADAKAEPERGSGG